MKKAFVVAFSLVGTLVGVGFVSGREIYSFFARFGVFGLISAAISSVIFGLTVFCFWRKVRRRKCLILTSMEAIQVGAKIA